MTNKKTVLITGASRGIGAEIACTFAKLGFNVVINYNKSEKQAIDVATKVQDLGGTPLLVKADVKIYGEVETMANKAVSVFGNIDVLVCSAGVCLYKLLIDSTSQDVLDIVNTNLVGVINACKSVSKFMIKAQAGKIINISSIWGVVGGSGESVYSATKAGVIGFSKALSKELGLSNINVNVVAPGVILTDMTKHLPNETLVDLKDQTSLGRLGDVKDIASVVEFLASDNASYITGQVIQVDGGM